METQIVELKTNHAYEYARERVKYLKEQATEAFKHHELISSTERSWFIAKRYPDTGNLNSVHAADIFVGHFGEIHVGGDLDAVVFGRYSDSSDVRGCLAWMGRHNDLSYYVAQKAAIGMTDQRVLTWKRDREAAELELKDLTNSFRNEWAEDGRKPNEKILDVIHAAEHTLEWESVERAEWDLVSELQFDVLEGILPLGQVLAPRVVYGWAAIRKLCDLLEIE